MAQTEGHRAWLAFGARVVRLLLRPQHRSADLVQRSYDRIADRYDSTWTNHMREFSVELLDRLKPSKGTTCLDLACGTGFLTHELARRTQGGVMGVDTSEGMLDVARQQSVEGCAFAHADIVEYLRQCRRHSVDIITCGWALGYSRPWLLVREASRVLRPGGRIGIIDNSLFSLSSVLWASILTFSETPEALVHVMQARFLPASWCLSSLMRLSGLSVLGAWDGAKTYHVPDGNAAVARLTATGAAAGFEFATDETYREAVFSRFAEVLEHMYRHHAGIPITHRYLAAVGQKP